MFETMLSPSIKFRLLRGRGLVRTAGDWDVAGRLDGR